MTFAANWCTMKHVDKCEAPSEGKFAIINKTIHLEMVC